MLEEQSNQESVIKDCFCIADGTFFDLNLKLLGNVARLEIVASDKKRPKVDCKIAPKLPRLLVDQKLNVELKKTDDGVFTSDNVVVALWEQHSIKRVVVNDIALISRSPVYEEPGLRAIWVDDLFAQNHKGLIRAAFQKYQDRCGFEIAKMRDRVQCARTNTSVNPLPINNDAVESLEAILDKATLRSEVFSDANVQFLHLLMVGPGTQIGRYNGPRGINIDRFDESGPRLGYAPVASMERNPSGTPWRQNAEMALNATQIDANPDSDLWAGVLAHEFTHTLFDIQFVGGHQSGDFVYALGDCVQAATDAGAADRKRRNWCILG